MTARHAVFVVLGLATLLVAAELRVVFQSERAGESRARDTAAERTGATGVIAERARTAPPANDGDAALAPLGWPTRLAWGSGPGALGREARTEGNAEGPAAIALGRDGTLLVLDTVNARLVLAGGGSTRAIASPLAAPFDAAPLPGGGFALLDRLVDRAIAIVDASGALRARVPLPARAGEAGLVTGVFAAGETLCVEREHGACVPVGTTKGEPVGDDQPEFPGRPASDGRSLLHAGIVAPPSARVHLTRSRARPFAHGFTRELAMPSIVRSVDFLDANDAGELMLAVTLESAPEEHLVLCLATETGAETARLRVPASPLPDEVNRGFAALPGGGFVYLYRTVDGAEPRRYPCAP
jgi:hypothetical protein